MKEDDNLLNEYKDFEELKAIHKNHIITPIPKSKSNTKDKKEDNSNL